MKQDNVSRDIKNVKIVLGNGFDLFCGLKTSYKDYYSFYGKKYAYLSKWINQEIRFVEERPKAENENRKRRMKLKT